MYFNRGYRKILYIIDFSSKTNFLATAAATTAATTAAATATASTTCATITVGIIVAITAAAARTSASTAGTGTAALAGVRFTCRCSTAGRGTAALASPIIFVGFNNKILDAFNLIFVVDGSAGRFLE
jgi:hypothetical protein